MLSPFLQLSLSACSSSVGSGIPEAFLSHRFNLRLVPSRTGSNDLEVAPENGLSSTWEIPCRLCARTITLSYRAANRSNRGQARKHVLFCTNLIPSPSRPMNSQALQVPCHYPKCVKCATRTSCSRGHRKPPSLTLSNPEQCSLEFSPESPVNEE